MEKRVGLLGAGFIAEFHARAVRALPDARIAWVCDTDRGRAEALAARIPGAKALASPEELFALGPEVVHVLVPPAGHASAVIAGLQAGAHVLVEKPLGTSSAEVAAIREAARIAGRRVAVNHNVLFYGAFQSLVEAIRGRALGRVEHVSFTWNVPLRGFQGRRPGHWMFKAPGNILFEQGVHPFSAVQFLLGGLTRASVVTSDTVALASGVDFHRTWLISLELARGTAQVHLSFGRDFPEIAFKVIGQDGLATVDPRRNVCELKTHSWQEPPLDGLYDGIREGAVRAVGAARGFRDLLLGTVGLRPSGDPFEASLRASVADFYGALREGREPLAGLQGGGEVVGMCEAIAAQLEPRTPKRLEEAR